MGKERYRCAIRGHKLKAQVVRVLDVLVIGPAMMRAGWLLKERAIGPVMMVMGAGTVVYNLKNYLERRNETKLKT